MRRDKFVIIPGQMDTNNKYESNFVDKVCDHTIRHIIDLDNIVFMFQKFDRIKITKDTKDRLIYKENTYIRIGRLLHPYVTDMQDRFSHFIVRRGKTKTPNYCIFDS